MCMAKMIILQTFWISYSKRLNQTWVSLSPIEPPQGGITKHPWQNSRNKCHVMLKGFCLRGVIKLFVFLRKEMGMWKYRYGHEKPRWKALRMWRLEIQSRVVMKRERMKVEMKVGILRIPICNGEHWCWHKPH
jgi:hypothetical protein